MKNFKLIILILVIAVFVMFVVQNFTTVSINLYKWSITLPLAFILTGIYVLGMFTGGLLTSWLKKLTNTSGLKK